VLHIAGKHCPTPSDTAAPNRPVANVPKAAAPQDKAHCCCRLWCDSDRALTQSLRFKHQQFSRLNSAEVHFDPEVGKHRCLGGQYFVRFLNRGRIRHVDVVGAVASHELVPGDSV